MGVEDDGSIASWASRTTYASIQIAVSAAIDLIAVTPCGAVVAIPRAFGALKEVGDGGKAI